MTIDGSTFMEYYDVESGLKVKADLGQAGVYTFADYTDVDGVMIPFKLIVKVLNSSSIRVCYFRSENQRGD